MASMQSSNGDSIRMKELGGSRNELPPRKRPGRFTRRTLIIVGVLASVLIIALAVGLGVGLTRNNGGGDEGSSPSSSSPVGPSPTANATSNGTYWQPGVAASWQIALQNPVLITADNKTTDPDVEVFDIDLFTNSNTTIELLHGLGKKVICYFSGGSYEPYRPDSGDFASNVIGKALDGWPDEHWIDLRSQNVRNIMTKRIELASSKGCDGLDPDNVDAYNNDNGLGLTQADTINYMEFLSSEAMSRNMSIGLKNAGEVLSNLTSTVQFSVNEQCVQFSECGKFAPMVEAGKPVFHIEYPKSAIGQVASKVASDFCSRSGDADGSASFSAVMKNMDLDGWVEFCDQVTANTTLVVSDP
ncbi:hypothetical protein B0A48_13579 [Cryoendolithus antarcticus]|uniref:alpha-galactosidase n=1 Tax=Cryoendolithus antarcticus TaxID=1507870 RepID=A0A1V8SPQ9_9PEZI|nr:hypothetical protein B0A48_13579 [Cryoendolithus antarcticus]